MRPFRNIACLALLAVCTGSVFAGTTSVLFFFERNGVKFRCLGMLEGAGQPDERLGPFVAFPDVLSNPQEIGIEAPAGAAVVYPGNEIEYRKPGEGPWYLMVGSVVVRLNQARPVLISDLDGKLLIEPLDLKLPPPPYSKEKIVELFRKH